MEAVIYKGWEYQVESVEQIEPSTSPFEKQAFNVLVENGLTPVTIRKRRRSLDDDYWYEDKFVTVLKDGKVPYNIGSQGKQAIKYCYLTELAEVFVKYTPGMKGSELKPLDRLYSYGHNVVSFIELTMPRLFLPLGVLED